MTYGAKEKVSSVQRLYSAGPRPFNTHCTFTTQGTAQKTKHGIDAKSNKRNVFCMTLFRDVHNYRTECSEIILQHIVRLSTISIYFSRHLANIRETGKTSLELASPNSWSYLALTWSEFVLNQTQTFSCGTASIPSGKADRLYGLIDQTKIALRELNDYATPVLPGSDIENRLRLGCIHEA